MAELPEPSVMWFSNHVRLTFTVDGEMDSPSMLADVSHIRNQCKIWLRKNKLQFKTSVQRVAGYSAKYVYYHISIFFTDDSYEYGISTANLYCMIFRITRPWKNPDQKWFIHHVNDLKFANYLNSAKSTTDLNEWWFFENQRSFQFGVLVSLSDDTPVTLRLMCD